MGLALALFCTLLSLLLLGMGEFKCLREHGVVNPRHIKGYIGVEDFQLVNGTLLASSEDRSWLRLMLPTSVPVEERLANIPDGALLKFESTFFERAKKDPNTAITADDNELTLQGFAHRFHPHGIFVHQLSKKEAATYSGDPAYLIASINNRPDMRCIELFTWNNTASNTLKHVGTISHPLIRWINDLTFVSAREFYVTNWLYHDPGTPACTADIILKRANNYVLRCTFAKSDASDTECKVVADGMRMPNGIQYLKATQQVAVADSIGRTVSVFKRAASNGALSLERVLRVNSACDNLYVLADGRLLSGCHPKQLTFGFHAAFHTRAPSQVLLLDLAESDDTRAVQEVLQTNTAGYSAATVAMVTQDNLMVMGSVGEDGVFIVDAPSSLRH